MSLLTQFYPGPGGGGGSSTVDVAALSAGATGSYPQITVKGEILSFSGTGATGFTLGSNSSIRMNPTLGATTGGLNLTVTPESTVILSNICYSDIGSGSTWTFSGAKYIVGGIATALSVNLSADSAEAIYGMAIYKRSVGITAPKLVDCTSCYFVSNASGLAGLYIQNSSLSADSVNHILITQANTGYTVSGGGTIDLSGGSSAGTGSLTTAGAAAVTTLLSQGWTAVTLNP